MTVILIISALAGGLFGGIGYLVMNTFAIPDPAVTSVAAGMMVFSLLAMTLYTYLQRQDAVNEQLDYIEETFPVKYLCRVNAEIKGRKFGRLYVFGDRFLLMSVLKKNIITEHLPYGDVLKLDYQHHKSSKALDLKIHMKNDAEHILTVIDTDTVVKALSDVGWSFAPEKDKK